MANRRLTALELKEANKLLKEIRVKLDKLSGKNSNLLFAYRRKVAKELGYDERGNPMHRRKIKAQKRAEQKDKCPLCKKKLPEKYAVLDRIVAAKGYTLKNTRLIHPDCDQKYQAKRKYA